MITSMIKISSLDAKIAISKRHPNETIREILRYDSGYLKDLFIKDTRIVFSSDCLAEIKRLTSGHKDNWETPKEGDLFSRLKTYASPYLYDFNDGVIDLINTERLEKYNS